MSDKIYCGNGKVHRFENGAVLNIMLDLDTLNREFNNHGFKSTQGNKKIKIKVQTRREPDQWGNTHSVIVDVWKPNQQNNNVDNQFNNIIHNEVKQMSMGQFNDDSIPF